jgi:uncharacterized protein
VRVETIGCDVTDEEGRSHLAEEIAERGLEVDTLVNNAGFGSGGAFKDLDVGKEAAMVRTNAEAVVALTSAFLPAMVGRGRGAILNLGSLIAFQPVPFQATYGATKAFVLSFTEALHEELRGTGVSVTVLCPGPVRTEFGEAGGFGGADERIPSWAWLSSAAVARAGVKGLENGRRVVVPGELNWLGALSGHYFPRALLLPALRRLWPVE